MRNSDRSGIPSKNTCMELLEKYKTPPHVIRHCKAVSAVAIDIGEALVEKGLELNLELLEAASLLHDIARVEEDHGVKGAIYIEKQGYYQVAKLVECHMYYHVNPNKEEIEEIDILCLADRMVKEDEYVGIRVRMSYVLKKLSSLGIDTARVRRKMDDNILLKKKIEKIIEKSIDNLIDNG